MKLNNCQVILPTFYPGKKIINCINSIPDKYPIAIIDNGNDDELGDILKKIPRRISHYKVGDIGLPKSFNLLNPKIVSRPIVCKLPKLVILLSEK